MKTAFVLLVASTIGGCLHVKVDPVEVKPITLNVNLKIDRELDEVFAAEPPAATQPAAPATQRVP